MVGISKSLTTQQCVAHRERVKLPLIKSCFSFVRLSSTAVQLPQFPYFNPFTDILTWCTQLLETTIIVYSHDTYTTISILNKCLLGTTSINSNICSSFKFSTT